jgi:hypothetical protein
MPYATLAELPAYVKSLPRKKKEQWRAIFNSSFAKHGEAGAFKMANAIIKEGVDMKKNGTRSFEFQQDLLEAVGTATVDREQGIINGVVLLTGEKISKNKTFYTKKALGEAVARYEGAKMFIDHPSDKDSPARSVRDLGGVYKNVRIEENKFLKADLHLLKSEMVRSIVLPIAEAKMDGVGLSIRDKGHGREEDGVFLVEGFAGKNGFSIDLVTEASVNENLFESNQGGDNMELSKVTLEELLEGNPTLVEKIKADERGAVMKELEEKIKKGEDAEKMLFKAKKIQALTEANLPKEVMDKISPIIEPEAVTFEVAEGIIKAQKEIMEGLKKPSGNDPAVKGHGDGKGEKDLHESELPTDEELVMALQ